MNARAPCLRLRIHCEVSRNYLQRFYKGDIKNRTVMLEAVVSPAWLAQCEGTNDDYHVGPRCSLRHASFRHVFYDCAKAAVPRNQWQYRLGWPLLSCSRQVNEARLESLASGVRPLWEQRHGGRDS